ncbi:hypothetical protein RFI_12033, partial [Reticulomyxa filosa]
MLWFCLLGLAFVSVSSKSVGVPHMLSVSSKRTHEECVPSMHCHLAMVEVLDTGKESLPLEVDWQIPVPEDGIYNLTQTHYQLELYHEISHNHQVLLWQSSKVESTHSRSSLENLLVFFSLKKKKKRKEEEGCALCAIEIERKRKSIYICIQRILNHLHIHIYTYVYVPGIGVKELLLKYKWHILSYRVRYWAKGNNETWCSEWSKHGRFVVTTMLGSDESSLNWMYAPKQVYTAPMFNRTIAGWTKELSSAVLTVSGLGFFRVFIDDVDVLMAHTPSIVHVPGWTNTDFHVPYVTLDVFTFLNQSFVNHSLNFLLGEGYRNTS